MENQQSDSQRCVPDISTHYSAEIIEEFITDGKERVKIYGIRITVSGQTRDEYRQITESFEKINSLCKYFTEYDIDFSHIGYIIEDFISELHFLR